MVEKAVMRVENPGGGTYRVRQARVIPRRHRDPHVLEGQETLGRPRAHSSSVAPPRGARRARRQYPEEGVTPWTFFGPLRRVGVARAGRPRGPSEQADGPGRRYPKKKRWTRKDVEGAQNQCCATVREAIRKDEASREVVTSRGEA